MHLRPPHHRSAPTTPLRRWRSAVVAGGRRGRALDVILGFLLLSGVAAPAVAQDPRDVAGRTVTVTVRPSAGVDSRVDYAALRAYGPWDDRNYNLTAADVALLDGDGRFDLRIPAFYRVELRRLMGSPGGQQLFLYPHSALPRFRAFRGGFLVDGRLYRDARGRDDGYAILDRNDQSVVDYLVSRLPATRGALTEVRVSLPAGGAESAVALDPTNPERAVAGVVRNAPSVLQDMYRSTDGGVSWTGPHPLPTGSCCDPTVGWSSDGVHAYTATLGASRVLFFRSADGGVTWDDLPDLGGGMTWRSIGTSLTDKEYLHVDRSPASPYRDRLHLTWHQNNVMHYAYSADRGATWSPPLSFPGEPRGIGSDITTDAAGNVYYLYPNGESAFYQDGPGSDIRLLKSTDGGASFGPSSIVADTEAIYEFPIPIMDSRLTWVHVSADADRTPGPFRDNLYATWTDATDTSESHARIRVAVSADGGSSWSVTTPHETVDETTVDRFHPWLAVDDDGNVHVIFYDTRADPVNRLEADLYHAVSVDGGATWSAPERLTSVSSPEIGNSFEWGDYNGLDIVGQRFLAVYTDNRAEGAEVGDSRDVYAIGRVLELSAIFHDGFESGDTGEWSSTEP